MRMKHFNSEDIEKDVKINKRKTPLTLSEQKLYKRNFILIFSSFLIIAIICIGFIDDDDICATPKPTDVKVGNNKNWGMRIILYSGIGIVVLMLILLWCYKRFINRALEESLTERIQLQTMTSIGQYKSFKEEGKGDTNNNPIEINNL